MDVLSDVVTALRTGRPHSSRNSFVAPWGRRFGAFGGAGVHIVLRGTCVLFRSDGSAVPLGPGDVVLLPHGCDHGLADDVSTPLVDADESWLPGPIGRDAAVRDVAGEPGDGTRSAGAAQTGMLCGAYLLDQARPHPLLADLPEIVHLPARIGRHSELRSTVDLLGAELDRPRPGTAAIVPALLDMLLLYILRAWYDDRAHARDGESPTGWAAALSDPAVSAALRAIHHDPSRPWTVESLGGHAGLSRAPFARRFAETVGRPPLAYLTWWRMTIAARLLRDDTVPVARIAERVGYTSEFAFAKAFKREYGTAPGGYRRGTQTNAAAAAPDVVRSTP